MRFYPGLTPGQWLDTPLIWIDNLLEYAPSLQAQENLQAAVASHPSENAIDRWKEQANRMNGLPDAPPMSKNAMAASLSLTGMKVEII